MSAVVKPCTKVVMVLLPKKLFEFTKIYARRNGIAPSVSWASSETYNYTCRRMLLSVTNPLPVCL